MPYEVGEDNYVTIKHMTHREKFCLAKEHYFTVKQVTREHVVQRICQQESTGSHSRKYVEHLILTVS